jgi:spermidine/putrescine transport system permease protein
MSAALAKAQTAMEKERPRASFSVLTATSLGFFLLYLPLVTMVISSVLVPSNGPGTPLQFGFSYYFLVFQDADLLNALALSFVVAVCSTSVATVLGTMGALALERKDFAGKKLFTALSVLPLVMPELVMGLSLLIWFVFLRLTLGTLSIVLAHITFCLSYVVVIVRTRLQDFDFAYEEAARDLGATPWQVFWTVTLPLITPGVLAAALMAFTLSFDDFLITFYTAGAGSDTLPLKIYSMIKLGVSPELNALATLLLTFTITAVIVVFRPIKRKQVQAK